MDTLALCDLIVREIETRHWDTLGLCELILAGRE
jgi:hypothetical protein